MNELLSKFKHFSKRNQVITIISLVVVLFALGILIWAIATGKIKPKAAGTQISNTATATYQDSSGNNLSAQSNTVLVDVATSSTVFNLKSSLQGKNDSAISGAKLDIYLPAQKTVTASQSNITSDRNGLASVSIESITAGTYDLDLHVPYFLSVKKTNVTIPPTGNIDFGELLTGDINNDNMINVLDYSTMISSWRKVSTDTGYNAHADIKQDNMINVLDFSMLITNWRKQGN